MLLHEHIIGLLFFLMSSTTMQVSDQKFRQQVALKDNMQVQMLTMLIVLSSTQIVATLIVFQKDEQWRALLFNPITTVPENSSIWEILWGVTVNDFCVRFFSIILKCVVLVTSFERSEP